MFNTSVLTKKLAIGVAAVGLATTASVFTGADSAEAVSIRFRLNNVLTSDGAQLSGWFDYNKTTNQFYGFNITSPAGSTITQTRTYNDPLNSITYASNSLAIRTQPTSVFPRDFLRLTFDRNITPLNIGDTANIIPGVVNDDGSYTNSFEHYFKSSFNLQSRTVDGGAVVVTDVPEPLTILGTLLAGGIGVALKKKKDSSVESC